MFIIRSLFIRARHFLAQTIGEIKYDLWERRKARQTNRMYHRLMRLHPDRPADQLILIDEADEVLNDLECPIEPAYFVSAVLRCGLICMLCLVELIVTVLTAWLLLSLLPISGNAAGFAVFGIMLAWSVPLDWFYIDRWRENIYASIVERKHHRLFNKQFNAISRTPVQFD